MTKNTSVTPLTLMKILTIMHKMMMIGTTLRYVNLIFATLVVLLAILVINVPILVKSKLQRSCRGKKLQKKVKIHLRRNSHLMNQSLIIVVLFMRILNILHLYWKNIKMIRENGKLVRNITRSS